MVENTREGLFTLDSAIIHKAVFRCLPYTHPPPYKFLGVIYMSVCQSVFLSACLRVCLSVLCGGMNRQSLYCKAICVLIYFFIDLTFIFGPFTSSFVFCLLFFKFCLQKGFFPLFSFAFCVLTFSFLLLSFVFKLLYFGFGFSHASFMIKKASQYPFKFWQQTNIRTDRQLIAYWILEGGEDRLIDRYVLHLMPSNFWLHCIRPT